MARSKPEWVVVRCAAELALNTTMRGCELKNLRWENVDFGSRIIRLQHSKTQAGIRTIPLNDVAFDAMSDLLGRAKELESDNPKHYVFPSCENGHFDATRPQKSWRTTWRKLVIEAGLPKLRFHDLRHHAITELSESLASDQTILSIAGHVSRRMLEHYSHVRLDAKRTALDALVKKVPAKRELPEHALPEPAYVTIDDTIPPQDGVAYFQVVESIMGATGIEPMTSTVSR